MRVTTTWYWVQKFLLRWFPVEAAKHVRPEKNRRRDAEIETFLRWYGNFPPRATPNCPSTEVSTFLVHEYNDAASLNGV
jgi:hypothetical protein